MLRANRIHSEDTTQTPVFEIKCLPYQALYQHRFTTYSDLLGILSNAVNFDRFELVGYRTENNL